MKFLVEVVQGISVCAVSGIIYLLELGTTESTCERTWWQRAVVVCASCHTGALHGCCDIFKLQGN